MENGDSVQNAFHSPWIPSPSINHTTLEVIYDRSTIWVAWSKNPKNNKNPENLKNTTHSLNPSSSLWLRVDNNFEEKWEASLSMAYVGFVPLLPLEKIGFAGPWNNPTVIMNMRASNSWLFQTSFVKKPVVCYQPLSLSLSLSGFHPFH